LITRTPNAALQLPGTADRGWDAPINGNSQQLDAVPAIGGLCVTQHEYPSTTLGVNVSAGMFINNAGVYTSYIGISAYVLPASTTNLLWLTDAGVLAHGTSWPTAGTYHVRLAIVITGVATITSIVLPCIPYRSASS